MSKKCLYIKKKLLKVSKISVVVTCMTAMLAVSQPVYAKNFIAAAMDEYLGSMSNSTSAKSFETSTRGVFSGGSFTVKNRVFNGNLVSFSPPSFKASCRGIDMFMGSFSFINADELIMLFRSIASNALGFLFKVALMVVSPAISEIMQKFSDIVREINKLVSDTCMSDMPTTIADINHSIDRIGTATTGLVDSVKNIGDNFAMGFQQAKDALSFNNPKETLEKTNPETARQMNIHGNMLWNAMKANYNNGIERPFNARLKDIGMKAGLEEIVLSLIGSIKVTPSKNNSAANSNDEANYQTEDIAPKLSFEHFVMGDGFEMWSCEADPKNCMENAPQKVTDNSKKGFAQLLYKQLCGTDKITSPCLADSAIERMVRNEGRSGSESSAIAILHYLDPYLESSISKLQVLSSGASQSPYSQSAGAVLIQKYIGTIALYSARALMLEMINEIRQQVSGMKNDPIRKALTEKIDAAEKRMNEDITALTISKIPRYPELLNAVKEHMKFYESIPSASGVQNNPIAAVDLTNK